MKGEIFVSKRMTGLLLALLLTLSALFACTPANGEESSQPRPADSSAEESEEPKVPDENAKLVWNELYADEANGIASPSDVYGVEYYFDGERINDYARDPAEGDAKLLFAGESATRAVNFAYGYVLTFPYTGVTLDNSLSAYRTKYISDNSILTVSYEDKNPYGDNENGWNIYLTEWLNIHIDSLDFLAANELSRSRPLPDSESVLEGYTVLEYDMYMRNAGDAEYPYYNIAIIRRTGEYDHFILMVMKSKTKSDEQFDKITASFVETECVGEAKNPETAYEFELPENWSEETRRYYELFSAAQNVSWGAFTKTIVSKKDSAYAVRRGEIITNLERLQGENGWDYNFDILPTYSAMGWYGTESYFPLEMAEEFAGGNGFNGKPVLQFTYQFTDSNNGNLGGFNPSFDILRGRYDDQFRRLAQDIKSYGKPVLFRLNNEMNSDWTSYSGICALLDPDIFRMTWSRLYGIFEEEGVDNCIWIFNPIAVSCPYSNWGEALNYMPDPSQMQALGLTYYEMGNGASLMSFKDMYTTLYEINMPYFDNYPWIISEFAAGCGGEKLYDYGISAYRDTVLGRNEALQAQWITDMFECFSHYGEAGYEFLSHIKGAIWFSCNDYADIGGKTYIINYLDLAPELTKSLAAFREGVNATGAKTVPKE